MAGGACMAGRWEVGFPNTGASSLREQAARKILRNVRLQGHTYVELRGDGKKLIYFCTLCLSPCYSDSVLFDHLRGNLHNERLSAAKITLLRPNPWPFNDGVVFFDNSKDDGRQPAITDGSERSLLESKIHDGSLPIMKYGENLIGNAVMCIEADKVHCNNGTDNVPARTQSATQLKYIDETNMNGECELVIPHVLVGEEILNLKVRDVGLGKMAARFFEKDMGLKGISRIWCEWLGKEDLHHVIDPCIDKHNFGVIVFSYNYNLGRRGLCDDMRFFLSSNPTEESENELASTKRRKKLFSDPEDISEGLSKHYDSSGDDSLSSDNTSTKSVTFRDSSASNDTCPGHMSDQYDNQLIHGRFISNKAIRKEMRRQQRVAAEKTCDICQHKMIPGKNVASLLNLKTGRLACSSRNGNGAFHVFHLSCLIHWILWCEFDVITNHPGLHRGRRKSKRKSGANSNDTRKEIETKATRKQMNCVFCPACQGSGMHIEGDDLEKITFALSEMFKIKIKVSDARRAWMKSPEVLQNCSVGFHFPSQSDESAQEWVKPVKLLHFYTADQ